MAGWHHQLDGYEFGQTPGVGGQGGLACCNSWSHKESDTTERLNGPEHELRQIPGNGEGQGGLVCSSPWGHKELDTTGGLN